MKFYEKGNKKHLNHRLFLSLLPRIKNGSRINNKICFRFCVETAYECVCVCVCRRTKMGRFLSNLFLNLWSVCVFVFCFAVDTSLFLSSSG